jgi:hypothetical protein
MDQFRGRASSPLEKDLVAIKARQLVIRDGYTMRLRR